MSLRLGDSPSWCAKLFVGLVAAGPGCVINEDLYHRLHVTFEDDDGDGYSPAEGDCDDADSSVFPGATEIWYDGVDQDCAGDDDFDADADGDPTQDAGGHDCDDEDAERSSLVSEGWTDLGIDNNCDGVLTEQVIYQLSGAPMRIDGPEENAALGTKLLTVPAGWISEEDWLLAAAPFHDGGSGTVYGWPATGLADAASLDSAGLEVSGNNEADYLGFGLGWSGDEEDPLVWIAADGAEDGAGDIYGWAGSEITDNLAPAMTISGETPSTYAGYRLSEGYDYDADGVADLVVSSPYDSAVAPNAGSLRVFLSSPTASESVALDDADLTFTLDIDGARIEGWRTGDLDGDGRDDLVAFTPLITDILRNGSFVITDPLPAGAWDIEDVFQLQVFGTVNTITDVDNDGSPEIIATTNDVYRYHPPASGTHLDSDVDGEAVARMGADQGGNEMRPTPTLGLSDQVCLPVAAPQYPDRNFVGRVYLLPWAWSGELELDDLTLIVDGEAPGDAAGTDVALISDITQDGLDELVLGAPGTDHTAMGAGSVYVVPSPH